MYVALALNETEAFIDFPRSQMKEDFEEAFQLLQGMYEDRGGTDELKMPKGSKTTFSKEINGELLQIWEIKAPGTL